MAGTNVEFGDPDWIHDYSYYGNGCPNEWVESLPNHGQSNVSCSSREIQADDGNQKIGTYYNFSAATVHTNRTLYENQNAPDTFCPLGWQLPYGGTGGDYYDKSRSFDYLIDEYGIEDLPSGLDREVAMMSYPFSLIHSGARWGDGLLGGVTVFGYYLSSTAAGNGRMFRIDIYTNVYQSNVSDYGQYPIRCVDLL